MSIKLFERWVSMDMGDTIHFDPPNIWGERCWQNGGEYMVSGIESVKESTSITDKYNYRLTRIGSASVSNKYNDVFIKGKDFIKYLNEGSPKDLKNISGWFTLIK